MVGDKGIKNSFCSGRCALRYSISFGVGIHVCSSVGVCWIAPDVAIAIEIYANWEI